MEFREVATDLKFPEGPVAMDDGSIVLVEIAAGRITRVKPDGKTQTIAKPGGGPRLQRRKWAASRSLCSPTWPRQSQRR